MKVVYIVVIVLVLVVGTVAKPASQSPGARPPPSASSQALNCSSNSECTGASSNCFNGGYCKSQTCFPESCQSNLDCCTGGVCCPALSSCYYNGACPSASPSPSAVTPSLTPSASRAPTPGSLSLNNIIALSNISGPIDVKVVSGRLALSTQEFSVILYDQTANLNNASVQEMVIENTYYSYMLGSYQEGSTGYLWAADYEKNKLYRYSSATQPGFASSNLLFQDNSTSQPDIITIDVVHSKLNVGYGATATIRQYDLNNPGAATFTYNAGVYYAVNDCEGGIWSTSGSYLFHNNYTVATPDITIAGAYYGVAMSSSCNYLYATVCGGSSVYVFAQPFSATMTPIQTISVGVFLQGITYDNSTTPNRVWLADYHGNKVYGLSVNN